MKPDNVTYIISTFADIHNLPSIEHVERCMADMPSFLLLARRMSDLVASYPGGQPIPFPKSFEWVDDGDESKFIDIEFVEAKP